MLAIVGAGFVGFLDDWIKVRNAAQPRPQQAHQDARPARRGHRLRRALPRLHQRVTRTCLHPLRLGPASTRQQSGGSIWAVFLILATTNAREPHRRARRPRRGLGDLRRSSRSWSSASGPSATPDVYQLPHALDLAVVAAAMLGACAGFLWWNAAPAAIFMGDTGALAIGGALAGLALATNTACCSRSSAAVRARDAVGDHPGDELPAVPAGASSAWRRSTTTSSSRAGRRPR